MRDSQHKHEDINSPEYRTKVHYDDGRYSWVEPLPDDFDMEAWNERAAK